MRDAVSRHCETVDGGFVVPATVAEQVSAVAGGAAVARAGWGHNGGVAALREQRQSD